MLVPDFLRNLCHKLCQHFIFSDRVLPDDLSSPHFSGSVYYFTSGHLATSISVDINKQGVEFAHDNDTYQLGTSTLSSCVITVAGLNV
jgi:hypothetical protein